MIEHSVDEVSRRAAGHAAASRPRVLLVAYHFPPSGVMGAQACAHMARYLPEFGWDPIVLTVSDRHVEAPDPRTLEGLDVPIARAAAWPHPVAAYASLRQRLRRRRGVGVAGASLAGASAASAATAAPVTTGLRRGILALLSTPDQFTGWLLPAVARGYRTIRRERVSYLLSSAPWWTNHVVALALKRLTGLPWTAHFRDPWSHWVDAAPPEWGLTRQSRWVHRRLERAVIEHADRVVCVTERHTEALRRAYPAVPAEKFVTITNGYSSEEFVAAAAGGPDPSRERPGQFAITYTGSLYMWRDLSPLFRVLRRLIDAGELAADDIVLNIVGRCDTAQGRPVLELAREAGLDSAVRMPGQVSRPQALRYMLGSDVLLVLAEGLTFNIPGKTYEYLRAGRPIIALTADGATADLIRETQAGDVIRPDDEAALAAALTRLVREHRLGRHPRGADPADIERFDRRTLTRRLAAVLAAAGS